MFYLYFFLKEAGVNLIVFGLILLLFPKIFLIIPIFYFIKGIIYYCVFQTIGCWLYYNKPTSKWRKIFWTIEELNFPNGRIKDKKHIFNR